MSVPSDTDLSVSFLFTTIYFRIVDYAKTPCANYSNYYAVAFNKLDGSCFPLTDGPLTCNEITGERSNDSTSFNLSFAYTSKTDHRVIIQTKSASDGENIALEVDNNTYIITISSPDVFPTVPNIKSFWV